MTFQDSVHKTVEVVEMNESRSGKSGTDYDITVITDGEEKNFRCFKKFLQINRRGRYGTAMQK